MKNAWKNKSHYDFYIKGYGRFLHAERLKCIKKAISQIIKTKDSSEVRRIIDLGCGDGILTTQVGTDKLKVIATDYDLERILKAKSIASLDEKFIVSDILKLVFKEEIADIVILHHVIEHLEKYEGKIIKGCYDILKKGGYLIIGVPNENSLLGRISRRLHSRLYLKGEHVNYYSERPIISLVESKGFVTKSVYRIGFLFPIYYIHMLLISLQLTFYVGHFLTKIFKSTADSLIIVFNKN